MSYPISKIKSSGGAVDADIVDRYSYDKFLEQMASRGYASGIMSDNVGYFTLDGAVIGANVGGHTDYIDVRGYDRVVSYSAINTQGLALAAYDENKDMLPDKGIPGRDNYSQYNLTKYELDLTDPDNSDVVYVRGSSYGSLDMARVVAVRDGFEEQLAPYSKRDTDALLQSIAYARYDRSNLTGDGTIIDPTDGYFHTGSTNASYTSVRLIDVHLYDTIRYVLFGNNLTTLLAFYDEKYEAIPSLNVLGETTVAVKKSGTIDLTDEAYSSVRYVSFFTFGMFIGTGANGEHDAFVELSSKHAVKSMSTSPLYGKTIDVIGDSIASTDYTRPNWWEQIAEDTGCTFNDYGWSGTTLTHTDDRHLWGPHFTKFDAEELGYDAGDPETWAGGGCMVERLDRIDASADAVVVMGGTNDSGLVKLGEWGSTDTSTWYGALNYLMQNLMTLMPGKPILFMTTIQNKPAYSSNVADPDTALNALNSESIPSLQLRNLAMRRKAAQYGIPVLDLWSESGISGAYDGYYRTDDTLHPSAAGQAAMKHAIQSKLEDLFR